ncbi:MAG: glycosyltransferase family 4 protein [Flavobacteriales bacterium]|nr:glycosyltransferase family 4 protein [Flavobacteriales bacterium]MCB9168228.1 glycosyltransferase family 4 protein [Flavobacteriales bacterium]
MRSSSTKHRVLFIADHRPDRSPGQRFRFEQYIDHLERHGFSCELSYLIDEEDDRMLYAPGNYLRKAAFLRKCHRIRSRDVERRDEFDIIFIFRGALLTRSIRYEKAFRQGRARIVFDFDDAIWLQSVSDANRRLGWMKDPGKTGRIIALSDLVVAGNAYLARYAGSFNPMVAIVPTTIDTDLYTPRPRQEVGPVVIGWSGSVTTIQHFQHAVPALRAIKERFGERVVFRLVGDARFQEASLGIQGLPWRKDSELADLNAMDIGIMPLPNDEWAQGKCGLKGLQYMALEIPTIMSPVGVNKEIIEDGTNGFLADGTDEWVEKLVRLVEDAQLRQRMGQEARRTVEERYSVNAWRDRYLTLFNELLDPR